MYCRLKYRCRYVGKMSQRKRSTMLFLERLRIQPLAQTAYQQLSGICYASSFIIIKIVQTSRAVASCNLSTSPVCFAQSALGCPSLPRCEQGRQPRSHDQLISLIMCIFQDGHNITLRGVKKSGDPIPNHHSVVKFLLYQPQPIWLILLFVPLLSCSRYASHV